MTQLTAPLIGDLVIDPPHPPAPRVAQHDQIADAGHAPLSAPLAWRAPLIDALAAIAGLAVAQLVGLALGPAITAALVLAWPLVLGATGCYVERPLAEDAHTRTMRVIRGGAVIGLASWVANLLVGPAAAPQLLVPATAVLTAAGLLTAVLAHRAGGTHPRLVLTGHPADVLDALTELRRARRPIEPTAVCLSEPAPPDAFAGLPVHVGVADAARVSAQHGADLLLALPGPDLSPALLRRLQWQASRAHTSFYVGTGLLDVAPTRLAGVQSGGIGALHVRPVTVRGPRRLFKEVVERLLAATALLVLLPVLLTVAIGVRRDSPGPAIFRQQRVGRHGQQFTMYKFRTMTCSAAQDSVVLAGRNDADGCLFKLRDDPRITRIGGVLRRYSIDELPQLWNVVAGQMSLVGPRPALPDEVDRYDYDPRRRLAVKPGLTGLWQVSGRSDLSWTESVQLDLHYVDNWTLGMDVSILRRTVGAVLGHHGAY